MDDIYKQVGQRIREERAKAGLTQEELAYSSDIHHSFLGHIECGRKKASLITIYKIARALNLQPGDLFNKYGKDVKNQKEYKLVNKMLSFIRDKKSEEQDLIISTLKTLSKKLRKTYK